MLLTLYCLIGRPDFMEAEIITMARKGEVDEALILLLEANAQQAEKAGAAGPAEVLRKLIKKASEEREKKLRTIFCFNSNTDSLRIKLYLK